MCGAKAGKRGQDSCISSTENATLRGAEGLQYLWRQLNSQEHMILTRRHEGHVGGRAIRRDRARSRSLICCLLFYMRGDPLFYERRALISVVPALFLNSTETDEIFITCSETTRVNTELDNRKNNTDKQC